MEWLNGQVFSNYSVISGVIWCAKCEKVTLLHLSKPKDSLLKGLKFFFCIFLRNNGFFVSPNNLFAIEGWSKVFSTRFSGASRSSPPLISTWLLLDLCCTCCQSWRLHVAVLYRLSTIRHFWNILFIYLFSIKETKIYFIIWIYIYGQF